MTLNLRLCLLAAIVIGLVPSVSQADELPAPTVRNPAAPAAQPLPASGPATPATADAVRVFGEVAPGAPVPPRATAPRRPAPPTAAATPRVTSPRRTRRAPVRTTPASVRPMPARPFFSPDNNGPVGPNNRGTSITSAVAPGQRTAAPSRGTHPGVVRVAPRSTPVPPPGTIPVPGTVPVAPPAAPGTPVFNPPGTPVRMLPPVVNGPSAPLAPTVPFRATPTPPAPQMRSRMPAPAASANPGVTFRFSIGDQLEISVWNEKELTTTHTVLRDGTVPAKAIGPVRVLGRTIQEVHDDLTVRYDKILTNPRVGIRVLGVHTERAYILGEVTKPAAVTLNGPVTLLQGIAQAGGFVNGVADLKTIRIVRSRRGRRPRVITVNTMNAIRGRAGMTQLQPGDVVYVHATGLADWSRRMNTALTPIGTLLGGLGSVATSVVAIDNN